MEGVKRGGGVFWREVGREHMQPHCLHPQPQQLVDPGLTPQVFPAPCWLPSRSQTPDFQSREGRKEKGGGKEGI